MTEILTHIDSREVERRLHQIVAQGKALPLRRIGVIGHASIMRTFQEEGRPQKWAPIVARSGRPLQDQGDLKRSVHYRIIGASNVAITTKDWRAPFHQYGTRTIPARPFMLWQREDIRKIVDLLRKHVLPKG